MKDCVSSEGRLRFCFFSRPAWPGAAVQTPLYAINEIHNLKRKLFLYIFYRVVIIAQALLSFLQSIFNLFLDLIQKKLIVS